MVIEKKHFEYLSIQRGEVAEFVSDFPKWKEAYENSIAAIMDNIRPYLPVSCTRVCDIGSGLGGIDVLLDAHYRGLKSIYLLDGKDDPPEVKWSFKTFSNAKVALDFQTKNGVKNAVAVESFREVPQEHIDLFVSFVAWGFHFPPDPFLEDIRRRSRSGTTIIVDIRQTKRAYLESIIRCFGEPRGVIERGKKHVRCVFSVA